MVININSSEQSRARLWLQPTPGRVDSASTDLWGASGEGLRLARPRGRGLRLALPLGLHSALPGL